MNFSTEIKTGQSKKENYRALFFDLEELEPFDIKKEELAAQLSALLSHSKLTRAQYSIKSGWKKSRVTNILNGRGNLTFKTIWEFARNLGYETDVIFRSPKETYAKQPWQKHVQSIHGLYTITSKCPLIVKTAKEVKDDMNNNNLQTHYVTRNPELPALSLQCIPSSSTHNVVIKIPYT